MMFMTTSDKSHLLKDALSHSSSALSELTAVVGSGTLPDQATLSRIERELRDAADLVRQSYRTDDIGEVETEAGEDI
jgi:hypothetical protein